MESMTHIASMDELVPIFREQLAAGQSVRFSPKGVSMLPMLREGKDSVVLSPLPDKLKKYDLPLYQRPNGKYILHRIVKVGQTYTCVGDHQFQLEHGVEDRQMIGVVTAFYRGKRMISVDNPVYRLYCLIWHGTRPVRHFTHRVFRRIRRAFQ